MVLENSFVDIQATDNILQSIRKAGLYEHYFPKLLAPKKLTLTTLLKLHITKGPNQLKQTSKLSWKYSFETDLNQWDVVSIVEYLSEYVRQKYYGIYSINGSSTLMQHKAILTWGGGSSMGKTGLCQLMQKRGGTFIYDEKVLISREGIVGGLPSLYVHKDYYKTQYSGEQYYSLKNQPLGAILPKNVILVYPHLLDSSLATSARIEQMSPERTTWLFGEALHKRIRGVSRSLFSHTKLAVSLDEYELATKRLAFIQNFTKQAESYELFGEFAAAAKLVKETIDEK